jgi:60 kDa SS-A/Ro ribonucleoprotein
MRLNVAARLGHNLATFEGAPAKRINPEQQLRRSVLACLLWEGQFYEDGATIAERIRQEALDVPAETLAALAVEARTVHNLRHVPLLLTAILAERARGQRIVADTIERIVDRADELAEFVAVYWRDGKRPLSAQVKKGLARAFRKFSAYQLGKYNRDSAIKLRDVLFMVHAKPMDAEQAATWKALVDGTLTSPDTWEVGLSGGADKRETFERLLREGKLGYLALLRNLRNMATAGVDPGLMRDAILARKGASRVLPFRYVAAARACPQMEPHLDAALSEAVAELPVLPGKTIVLVDVSGSMEAPLSAKSDLKRIDAAAALASVLHGERRVFTFSSGLVEVPPRYGMAGVDAILRSQPHGSTFLGAAVRALNEQPHDRLIVVTDEQSHDVVPDPSAKRAYMINVASARNGVGYGRWTHIDGFSEGVLRYIAASENDG